MIDHPSPERRPAVPTEQNKAIVRRLYEEAWSRGNLDVADELLAPDYQGIARDTRGPAGFKRNVGGRRVTWPDLQVTIEEQIAEGDLVVSRLTFRGTQRGPLTGAGMADIAPTGKATMVSGIHIHRIVDGKIVEHWGLVDSLGLLQQLGALPAPGSAQA
jgi:predicted ester cyclase